MSKTVSFFCIGAQKAGTSTLHDILDQHPDLCLPTYKETHFFRDDEVYEKGLSHYFDYFFTPQPGQRYGEIDPEYAYFDGCAERLHQAFPDAKIVFILRNPVERAYSHYLMTRSRGLEDLSFQQAVQQEESRLQTHYDHIHFSYMQRGYYSQQWDRYAHFFGAENVAVYLFEELIGDTAQTVKSIASFVGLSEYDYDFDIQSNPASEAKSKAIRDFVYKPNKLKKSVGKLIPSQKMKDKIMATIASKNKKAAIKQAIPTAEKRALYQQYFQQEIATLEQRLARDLSAWKYLETQKY